MTTFFGQRFMYCSEKISIILWGNILTPLNYQDVPEYIWWFLYQLQKLISVWDTLISNIHVNAIHFWGHIFTRLAAGMPAYYRSVSSWIGCFHMNWGQKLPIHPPDRYLLHELYISYTSLTLENQSRQEKGKRYNNTTNI
jgi:hypothetical protein